MLLDRNEAGDHDKARTLLGEAIDQYRTIGMPKHLEMAERMLASTCHARPAVSEANPFALNRLVALRGRGPWRFDAVAAAIDPTAVGGLPYRGAEHRSGAGPPPIMASLIRGRQIPPSPTRQPCPLSLFTR